MRRVLLTCMCATVAHAGYARFEVATADGSDATTGYPDRATVKFRLDYALAKDGRLRFVTAANTGAYSALSFSSATPAVGATTPVVGIDAGFLKTTGTWDASNGYVEATVDRTAGLDKDTDYAFIISSLQKPATDVADRQGADNALTLVVLDANGNVQERRAVYFQPWSTVGVYTAAQVLADSKVKMPGSCVCADASKDNATCAYFSCPCTCDVTAGRCDANCCCDPDCKSSAVHGGSCTVMPSTNTAVRKCTDSRSVYKVNAKYRMRVTEESDAFGALLCVQKDNSESMGDYLQEPEPETVTNAVFDSNPNAKSLYSLEQNLAETATSSSASLPQAFAAGDRIPAAFQLTASGADQNKFKPYGHGGYWTYPDTDFSGGCGGRHAPTFLRPSSATCMRATDAIGTSSDVPGTCTDSDFDIARYVTSTLTSVNAAVKAGVAPSSHQNYAANDGNHWVDFTLSSWTKRDLATGRDGITGRTAPTATTFNGGTCQNAVLEAHYTVTYTDAFAIESVAVALVLADVTAASKAVRQSFSVRFARKGASPLYRLRSGNPGYELGSPLLSGTEVSKTDSTGTTQQKAVAARAGGLTLLGAYTGVQAMNGATALSSAAQPAIGACAAEQDAASRTPVGFGEDASVGCTMSFTRAELKTYCETQRKATGTGALGIVPKDLLVEPGDNSAASEYVGRLGNADPSKLGEWVLVNRDAVPTVEPTWDEDTSECRNLVVGVSYKVLYTGIGAVSHPQYKILKVQASYHQSTWRYEDGPGPTFGSAARRFSLHSSISFIQWGLQQKQEYVPPAPPMIFSLPEDVFYPFKLSAASPSTAPSLGIAMVTVLLCLQQLWAHDMRD